MNRLFGAVAVAAVIVVAACNGGGEDNAAASSEQRNEAVSNASNVSNATAAPRDHAAIMHDRHENYEEMGKAMKGVTNELKAGSPSVETIQRHAALMARFGPQIPSWFPTGSGPETGRRTRAKAEIWSDPETFRSRAQRFEQTSAAFNRAAQGGDLAAVRAALPELRDSCKQCHDRFRGPEHD